MGGAKWAGGLHEPTGTQAASVHAALKVFASYPHSDVAEVKSNSSRIFKLEINLLKNFSYAF